MRRFPIAALFAALAFSGCGGSPPPKPSPAMETQIHGGTPVEAVPGDRVTDGQTIYVPAYSFIYSLDRNRTVPLTVTLSVRNTDGAASIVLTAVRFYDATGRLLKNYLPKPLSIGPMATVDFIIGRRNGAGDAGANFIVEWVATQHVDPPLVEAVMISTANQQGLSFTSRGRVLRSRGRSQTAP